MKHCRTNGDYLKDKALGLDKNECSESIPPATVVVPIPAGVAVKFAK
jgi:hypothetical protein